MRLSSFVAACALGLLLGCPRLFAEPVVITVRVIDARNGNPYKKLRLRAGWRRASAALRLTGRTDFRRGGPWSRRTRHSDNKTGSLTRATDRESLPAFS